MITRLEARCKRPFWWEFKNFFFGFPRRKQNKINKKKNVLLLPGPWSFMYLRIKQREGGNEVVFSLAIKSTALIQWHKLKKETPRISYMDMLNRIIPDHALNISWESDRIEGRLSKRCSAGSITNQILNRKVTCKNRKGHNAKLCRLTILKSEIILVGKWEVDLCSIQSKIEKEICNWRAKRIMPQKRKEQENWTMKINNWLSTLTGYRMKTWGFTEELEFQTSTQNKDKPKIKWTKDSSTEGT